MLAIRLQRVGRKGYPVYRLAVQEAQRHPSSGRVVAYVGSYNPHTKESKVQVEEAKKHQLKNQQSKLLLYLINSVHLERYFFMPSANDSVKQPTGVIIPILIMFIKISHAIMELRYQ